MRTLTQFERMKVKLQNAHWDAFHENNWEKLDEIERAIEMHENIMDKFTMVNGKIDLRNCSTAERKFFWKLVRDRNYMDMELGI